MFSAPSVVKNLFNKHWNLITKKDEKMNKLIKIVLALLISTNLAMGAATFTKKPKATLDEANVKISFVVSEPTDVEVAILDNNDKIVRRLAAGMLGKNSPAPFQKGLKQSILWDLNNDAGQKVKAEPSNYKIDVRLGIQGKLHKVMGWSGQKTANIVGMTTGPDGTLYVIQSQALYAHRTTWTITAFNRDGKYLRQIFPGPANLPPEKREGWPRITLEDANEVPVIFHLLAHTTYPGAVLMNRMFPVVTSNGQLILFSGDGHSGGIKYADLRGNQRRLLTIGTDGSVPKNWLGPEVCPIIGAPGHTALSPDEKYIYVTGLTSAGSKAKGHANVVYKVEIEGSTPSEIIIGKLFETIEGKSGLNDPEGIAVDKDGNIFISDYGNNRIAVFKPDGSFLDEILVDTPNQVLVSHKTGAIYILSIDVHKTELSSAHWYTPHHNWRFKSLVKIDNLKNKNIIATLDFKPKSRNGGGPVITLDESGDIPVLWAAGLDQGRNSGITKIIDKGGQLESLGEVVKAAYKAEKAKALDIIGDVTVIGDRVTAGFAAFGNTVNAAPSYDIETGKYIADYSTKKTNGTTENVWSLLYGETTTGKDGNVYARAKASQVRRFDINGNHLPFTATGNNTLTNLPYGHTREAGIFIDKKGSIYVPTAAKDRAIEDINVKVFNTDGNLQNDSALHVQNARMAGIAVDSKGNIYIGAQAAPKDSRIPAWFAGKLPADSESHHPSNDYKQYASIFKFPPSGGSITLNPAGTYTAIGQYKHKPVSINNALWSKRFGYIGSHGKELGCHCETTRFDIDGYDRIFITDIFRFRVYVLDSAGNEITHFGSYGNMDSRGKGSAIPEPEITFGWPLSVDCAQDKAFIADLVNKRVVSVKFEHTTTASCRVK